MGTGAREPQELMLRPSFPGTQDQDPHLGKWTTCLLGFIWFQGEATGFTLKITKLANSFNMQMFFCI